MKIKIVIFVLLAALAQSSCTGKTYSKSQNDVEADFSTIGSSEKRVHRANNKTFNFVFDVKTGLANVSHGVQEELKHDLPEPEVINNMVNRELSNALFATIHAIVIIQPDPSADPTRWDLVKQKLKGIVERTTSAVLSSRNSCTSLAQIGKIEKLGTENAIEICEHYFNSMTVGRSNETAVIDAVGISQEKAVSDVRVVFRSIFDTIEILHEIDSSDIKAKSEQILATIEFMRNRVLENQRDKVQVTHDSIYTIYATDLLAEPKIATQFSALQSRQIRQINDWRDLVDTVWEALYEIDITEGALRTAKEKVLASLNDAFVVTADAFEIIRLNNSYKIEDDERVDGWLNDVADGVVDALEITRSRDSSRNLDKIEALDKKVASALSSIISSIFNVTAKISINRTDVTAAMETVQKSITPYIIAGFHTIFDVFRLTIAETSSNAESRRTSLFFELDPKIVAISYLKRQSQFKFGLFRKLYVVNSLHNHGIDVDYNIFDIFLS